MLTLALVALVAACDDRQGTRPLTPVDRPDDPTPTQSSSGEPSPPSEPGEPTPPGPGTEPITCTEDLDCPGQASGCNQWKCNPSSHRCEEVPSARCNECGSGGELKVRFYDVAQGLAVLLTLPDGRHVMVDTGESPTRQYCGSICQQAHQRLMAKLERDVGEAPIEMLWLTHPHSDHVGGAPQVLERFQVRHLIDNGRDLSESQIANVRARAAAVGTDVVVVSQGQTDLPIAGGAGVHLSAVLPSQQPTGCATNRNLCSIALRVDYCDSSALFVGDLELAAEAALSPGKIGLLQVGHHGSEGASSAAFLNRISPDYAVISHGKRGEGTNSGYCHPRSISVNNLTQALGGAGSRTLPSFDGSVACRSGGDANWDNLPVSDRLWSTARDGDVRLTTHGDGVFAREANPN